MHIILNLWSLLKCSIYIHHKIRNHLNNHFHGKIQSKKQCFRNGCLRREYISLLLTSVSLHIHKFIFHFPLVLFFFSRHSIHFSEPFSLQHEVKGYSVSLANILHSCRKIFQTLGNYNGLHILKVADRVNSICILEFSSWLFRYNSNQL